MEPTTVHQGREGHVGDPATLGIVTVSDRASQGEYTDEGGPAILKFFSEAIKSPLTVIYRCIPDDVEAIQSALIELVDVQGCHVVVTTGGTGPAARDVTPEATEAVCDRMMPGFGEQMRAISWPTCPPQFFPARLAASGAAVWCSTFQVAQSPSARPSMKFGKPCRTAWI